VNDNAVMAEFVGGPLDGKQQCLIAGCGTVTMHEIGIAIVDESCLVKMVNHKYQRRSINGVFVKLPNGMSPFDWIGGEA
jgi:hypothetical protein